MSTRARASGLVPRNEAALVLDDVRQASWLKSKYSASAWIVTDTDDDNKQKFINFEYRLADGRCLTEAENLYATVKEYAWFVRDPRFSKIDTANAHAAAVSIQRAVAHALTLRGIASYSHLQRGDVESLVQELRFGMDGLLQASSRVAAYVETIERDPKARSLRYNGFPVARTLAGFSKNMIDSEQIVAACNLPDIAKLLSHVAWVVAAAAGRNGMTARLKIAKGETIPPPANVTKQQLQRSLDVLDLLFAIRHHAQCEVPKFRPFPDGVMKVANQYGEDHQPTPVPPPKLVLHLIEAAAKWVGKHSQAILSCLHELESVGSADNREVQASLARCQAALPAHIRNRLINPAKPDRFLLAAVEMLATACWVIIAAFGARRYEETIDLNEGSLLGSDEDGWWLDCYISKTTRKRELIPVPLIVARAVETLISISATANAKTQNDVYRWLVPPALNLRSNLREISPRKLIKSFAELAGTPPHVDAGKSVVWHWIPRQFRRFFAVLYFYRYDGADLAILSYFLRHFDIETTRGYVTRDAEAAKIWRDVEKDYVRRLADAIVDGDPDLGGAMSLRLKKIAKLISDRLDKHLIVTKEPVSERIQTIMERGLVITPKPWVTCTCPRTSNAAKKARCRANQEITTQVVGPSYADAGPTICTDCRWALEERKNDDYACHAQTQLEASVGSGRGDHTLFGELERSHLVQLRRVTGGKPTSATPSTEPDHG